MILEEDCVLVKLDKDIISHCQKFECGNDDLDEFFNEDAILYDIEFLGKTYCWIKKDVPDVILAAFTLANDSIKTHGMPIKLKIAFNVLFQIQSEAERIRLFLLEGLALIRIFRDVAIILVLK